MTSERERKCNEESFAIPSPDKEKGRCPKNQTLSIDRSIDTLSMKKNERRASLSLVRRATETER